jgi:hypothetical protein
MRIWELDTSGKSTPYGQSPPTFSTLRGQTSVHFKGFTYHSSRSEKRERRDGRVYGLALQRCDPASEQERDTVRPPLAQCPTRLTEPPRAVLAFPPPGKRDTDTEPDELERRTRSWNPRHSQEHISAVGSSDRTGRDEGNAVTRRRGGCVPKPRHSLLMESEISELGSLAIGRFLGRW